MVRLLYFAWVREKIGRETEDLAIPEEVATVNALIQWLATRSPGHAEAFGDPSKLRCALDQTMVTGTAPLAKATEIAFFPPVTGG